MSYNSLSNKQMEIYNFLKQYIGEKGYPPSIREICVAVGLKSTSTVHAHLKKLENKGYIRKDPSKPRAIEIVKDSNSTKEMLDIPIVGNITAGSPILAIENIEDNFLIPMEFVNSNKELFMLHVKGDSMIDSGIMDGDLAIIEKCNYAENGDIVAALIDDEATIKTFFKESNYIRLQPENKLMDPIIVKECSVLGKLVGLYRKY